MAARIPTSESSTSTNMHACNIPTRSRGLCQTAAAKDVLASVRGRGGRARACARARVRACARACAYELNRAPAGRAPQPAGIGCIKTQYYTSYTSFLTYIIIQNSPLL